MPELTEPVPLNKTLAPTATREELPRDAIDRAYLEADWPAGFEPELARKKQFAQVMSIPGVVFGQIDRGHRAGDPQPLEQIVEPTHTVEVVDQVLEEDRHYEQQRRAVWDVLAIFVADANSAHQAGVRFAAWLMRAGAIGPTEMKRRWPDLTETPLRSARKHLEELLSQEEGGAK